ncbi:MAG: DUF2339 domain-containing protein [Candidatus Magasanikbacteria bacterium]|nr:DUF2339 domain-containing protein [Candidatus Magasanikbacteria bacterium]
MEIINFLGLAVLLFLVLGLRDRVSTLEWKLKEKGAGTNSKQNEPTQDVVTRSVTEEIHVSTTPSVPNIFDRFFNWLKEDWILKLGALILLIGFGWFASYAFLNNWIGPMGRIILGVLAGLGILVLGWWRIHKYVHQGGIFLVLGSTTILLTLFAAREVYNFFTPLTALIGMFLSIVFVGVSSVKFKVRSLALASLLLAAIAPYLINVPAPNYIGQFVYLLVVVLGIIWIVFFTSWRELNLAALAVVAWYSLPHITHSVIANTNILLVLAYIFGVIFLITNIIGILRSKDKDLTVQLMTAIGTAVFLLVWTVNVGAEEWKSLMIAGWSALYLLGAFLTWELTKRREAFYIYFGASIILLAAALSVELSGHALIMAYTAEAIVATVVTYLTLNDIQRAQVASMFLLVPSFLSLKSFTSNNWDLGVFHQDFFTILIIGLAWIGLGVFFTSIKARTEGAEKESGPPYYVFGSVFLYALLWLSLHAALASDSVAVMIALFVYTVIGIGSYVSGINNDEKGLKIYGGALIGLVVARLFLIDVWQMELTGRIIVFFMVGTLLVSTAFMGRKTRQIL